MVLLCLCRKSASNQQNCQILPSNQESRFWSVGGGGLNYVAALAKHVPGLAKHVAALAKHVAALAKHEVLKSFIAAPKQTRTAQNRQSRSANVHQSQLLSQFHLEPMQKDLSPTTGLEAKPNECRVTLFSLLFSLTAEP